MPQIYRFASAEIAQTTHPSSVISAKAASAPELTGIVSVPDNCVLLTWLGLHNDPYQNANSRQVKTVEDQKVPGPTLTLLFDEASPYRGKIRDLVIFYRANKEKEEGGIGIEFTKAREMLTIIREHDPSIQTELRPWQASDPADHRALYAFLEKELPTIRRKYRDKELIINVSPGTPAMHTVWVLMVETGFIPPPVQLVQTLREHERNGRPPTVPVEIGIPSLLKLLQEARPARESSAEERVWWNQAEFRSPKLKAVYEQALRFAKLKVPILILGERGTGKTRLAGWIRMRSPWRIAGKDKAWPSVPCGQYSPELMRAELFGHAKGAFTGALQARVGMLAQADGDTLFLDEIGDISRELQRMLIRAVEDHSYVRLGDTTPSHSDFRLITATNLPWSKLQSRLDPDFLDRISYLTLRMPPLREVGEDIPWLWKEVLAQAALDSRLSGRSAQLKAEDHRRIVKALQEHPLPGNMRDLFRVAYHLLSALASDGPERLSRGDAVRYAIQEGLEAGEQSVIRDLPREVCAAYAEQAPLDAVLRGRALETSAVERGLRRYLALELRRMAKEQDVEPNTLADVSLRTLQNWAKGEE